MLIILSKLKTIYFSYFSSNCKFIISAAYKKKTSMETVGITYHALQNETDFFKKKLIWKNDLSLSQLNL